MKFLTKGTGTVVQIEGTCMFQFGWFWVRNGIFHNSISESNI